MKWKNFQISESGLKRFINRIIPQVNGCWIRRVKLNKKGYSETSITLRDGRHQTFKSHQLSFYIWNGPIPNGLVIDHLCRNRACVNPDHLEAVTPSENVRRGNNYNRDKTHCIHGHPFTKQNTLMYRTFRRCKVCIEGWKFKYKEIQNGKV